MQVSVSTSTTISALTTSALQRLAERRRRQEELIAVLRRAAYLCCLEHGDTPGLAERTRIAALVDRVDAALRKLLNQPATR